MQTSNTVTTESRDIGQESGKNTEHPEKGLKAVKTALRTSTRAYSGGERSNKVVHGGNTAETILPAVLIAVLFLSLLSIGAYYYLKIENSTAAVAGKQEKTGDRIPELATLQEDVGRSNLEKLGVYMVESQQFGLNYLGRFQKLWNTIAINDRKKVVSQSWFKLFAANIMVRIENYELMSEVGDEMATIQAQPLIALYKDISKLNQHVIDETKTFEKIALSSFTSTKKGNGNSIRADAGVRQKHDDISRQNKNKILEKNSKPKFIKAAHTNSVAIKDHKVDEKAINLKLKSEKVIAKQMPAKNGSEVAVSMVEDAKPAPRVVAGLPSYADVKELRGLLDQFEEAYDLGELNKFGKLFTDDIKTNDHTTLAGMLGDYTKLFRDTNRRHLVIDELVWKRNGDGFMGNGKLNLVIQNSASAAIQKFVGNVVLAANKETGELKISKLVHEVFPTR